MDGKQGRESIVVESLCLKLGRNPKRKDSIFLNLLNFAIEINEESKKLVE